jgi:hypothetical protein
MKWAIVGLILVCAASASAQKLDVKVVGRQDSATGYTYFAPGYFNSQSSANADCYGDTSVHCNGSITTNGTITAPRRISYQVRGATFTLLLPDGRGAVVNCESKYAPKFDYINRRDCRVPLVEDIRAEFAGDKAKLEWVVSLDGKKIQSETYKVLAVLNKPKSDHVDERRATASSPAPPATVAPKDVFVWFDEPTPALGVPLFEVFITSHAYDGALAVLRQARQGNTSVQAGTNVLDSDYHPSTMSFDSRQKSQSNSAAAPLFYWQGEEANGTTQVMHFEMTKRAYEQMLALVLVASSDLRVRLSQKGN